MPLENRKEKSDNSRLDDIEKDIQETKLRLERLERLVNWMDKGIKQISKFKTDSLKTEFQTDQASLNARRKTLD